MKILETPRLILREWKDEDIPAFAAMNQDPRVMEFFPKMLTAEESASLVEWMRRHLQEHGFSQFAIELKATKELIGFVGLSTLPYTTPFTPCVEMAWRIAFKHWNQGYATEAAKAVLHAAFEKYGLREVVSFTSTLNKRSMRIMEKIGMQRDLNGDFDHPNLPKDHPLCRHVLYRIKAEDLRSQDSVQIEPYHPHWPKQAEQEIARLKGRCHFPWLVNILHIGSTAVPNLPAKPILDLAIGVTDLEQAKALIPLLIEEGYVFWDANPDPSKLFFAKGMPPFGKQRTHHVHVMATTHYDWVVRPLFRNYLIAHPQVRDAYAHLKKTLAEQYREDREKYTQAKTQFIRDVNLKAILPLLHFETLTQAHFPLLLRWFNLPHVQEFYSLRTWTLEEIEAKFKKGWIQGATISRLIAYVAEVPVAYIQYYPIKDYSWKGQDFSKNFISRAAGIDFFIGEPTFLRKKIGSLILDTVCQRYLADHYEYYVVDPDIRNLKSIQFFKQRGFKAHQILTLPDALGRTQQFQLMVKTV